jgi:DNA helicase-2/ATP-dependent DNA helicase PcrA
MPPVAHAELAASLSRLNPWQQQAVCVEAPSLLVRAQVGSGKTTVLVHRLLWLHLQCGVPLAQMAVITFTRKAAAEIRRRVEALLPPDGLLDGAFQLFGTFHAVARTLLRRSPALAEVGLRPDFGILDEAARDALWRRLVAEHGLDVKYVGRLAARAQAFRQGHARFGAMQRDDDLARLLELAREEKRRLNVVDFDDLIELAAVLPPPEPPLSAVLVDEFQDCEPREVALLRRLVQPSTRGGPVQLFAVGDPYQSIYAWRGGTPALFDAVQREFACRPMHLPVNYRSTGAILGCAQAVLGAQLDVAAASGPAGQPPGLRGVRDDGAAVVVRRHLDALQEALYVAAQAKAWRGQGGAWRDVAVLFRTRRPMAAFAQVLAGQGIPVRDTARVPLLERPAAVWVLGLLRLTVTLDSAQAKSVLTDPDFGLLGKRAWPRQLAAGESVVQWLAARPTREARAAAELLQRLRTLDANADGLADRVWRQLELSSLLRPTSARHVDDVVDVRTLLTGLELLARQADPQANGLRHALAEFDLHGPLVLHDVGGQAEDAVQLLTLHAAKGLEFMHVFISGVNQGAIPLASSWGNPQADAEERRLLFVGMSRARDTLELGWHARPGQPQVLDAVSPLMWALPARWVRFEEAARNAAQGPMAAPAASNTSRALPSGQVDAGGTATGESGLPTPWAVGSRVRHGRYGEGIVTVATEDLVSCHFNKFGEKSFPRAMCPLSPLAG